MYKKHSLADHFIQEKDAVIDKYPKHYVRSYIQSEECCVRLRHALATHRDYEGTCCPREV